MTLRRNRLLLIALWLVFYASLTLFTPPLLDDADSVHAEVAREMLTRHDFVTLYANGIRYLEKAPLFYWSMAASFKLFGVSTAASRLPLAFAILLLTLLLEHFARTVFNSSRTGLYAGLITLSSFGLFIFSRINIPDVLVCCWLTLALLAFWHTEAQSQPSRLLCWTFALACALNILTKGLIGIVFPTTIVLATLLAARGVQSTFSRLRQLHPLSSLAVFFLVAAPWHILAALANPTQGHPRGLTFTHGHFAVPLPTQGNVHGWAWFYFVNEQLLRYLNLRVPRDYDTVPLWLFLGLLFVWLLPWSAFLPAALAEALPLRAAAFRARLRTRTLTPDERTSLFLLLWAAIPLAFFSLSTRQEYYVLPSLPPLILLIARSLAQTTHARSHRRAALVLFILGSCGAAAALFFLIYAHTPAPGTDLTSLLTHNPADYALSFGHFLDLTGPALGLFRLPLALVVVTGSFGTLAPFLLRRAESNSARIHAATLTLAATAFVVLLASWSALRTFSPTLTSSQLAAIISPQIRSQDLLVIHGEYEFASTLAFYLHRADIHLVEGRSANLWYGSFFPDAPRIFDSPAALAARWPGPQRIFLWQTDPATNPDPDRPSLTLPAPVYVIASSGGKQILSNQPPPPGAP